MVLFTNSSYFVEFGNAVLPYFASHLFVQYGIPTILTALGFGSLGIIVGSIASRIQAHYGVSYLFSVLQSIGACGGIQYPKLWSAIIGSIYNLFASRTNRQSDHGSSRDNSKSQQTHDRYSICPILFCGVIIIAFWYLWSQRNLQQATTNGNARNNTPPHRRSTAIAQEPQKILENTLVPVQAAIRSSRPKVTKLLPQNLTRDYTCPKCQKRCKPQGITGHVKACDKRWCKRNGI